MKSAAAADDDKKSLDRRTWMSWVGKAAVVSLGAELIAACEKISGGSAAGTDSIPSGTDGDSSGDTAADGGTPPDKIFCGDAPLDFAPGAGEKPIYEGWPVRTVDAQDLTAILASWTLSVGGMVENPRVLRFADILRLPRQDQITDFHCVEGWSVYDVPWNGVHLSELIGPAVPLPQASYVTFHTIGDTYNESLPLEIALEPKTLLAYGIDCATLPMDRGFPLRLVIPRLLGYKGAKYVYSIELTDAPISGYWVKKGYTYEGEVPPSRLREGKY